MVEYFSKYLPHSIAKNNIARYYGYLLLLQQCVIDGYYSLAMLQTKITQTLHLYPEAYGNQ